MKLANLTFKKGKYLAFTLSPESRAELLKLAPPRLASVICHHVTVEFKLTEKRFKKFQELTPEPTVVATGVLRGNDIECITVELDDDPRRNDGGWYHVTLSLEPPARPVDSNALLKSVRGTPSEKFKRPLTLTGNFELLG
jgi:hypothetical protein